MKLAHEVELVYRDNPGRPAGLYVDGILFPYYISEDVTVDTDPNALPSVTVSIFANAITLTRDLVEHPVTPTLAQDLDWARERAKEIVRDGFSDVLAWLDDARKTEAAA